MGQQVNFLSQSNGNALAELIKSSPLAADAPSQWPEPIVPESGDDEIIDINIIDELRGDILTRLSIAISDQVQFPRNTAFLHGIGIVASVMTKAFSYEYYGSKAPVNLYVVTSQPPSTGKSGINRCFSDPARTAFAEYNKGQHVKRMQIEGKIKQLRSDVKGATNDIEISRLSADIIDKESELLNTPVYKYSAGNATPEALEQVAFSQRGTWNVISDEAGPINVLLGNVYSDKIANADIVLQSWDGDYLASSRISREGGEGYVRGTIAVIAQDETIKTILEAGARGNGVSERFLLLRESNLLGARDHCKFVPVSDDLLNDYDRLIHKLALAENITLKFSHEAIVAIRDKKISLEPHLADGEKYSNNMLRGAIGKMDKQVMKIACVLHAIISWSAQNPSLEVQRDTAEWAIQIHDELMKMYISAADNQGFIGSNSEAIEIVAQFRRFMEKKRTSFSVTALRDCVKSKPVFKNRPRLSAYLSTDVLPRCEELGLCIVIDKKIYINPRFE